MLLSQLLSEWLDVVCSTLHLRATKETSWIVRVWIGVGEEGFWEYLIMRGGKGFIVNSTIILKIYDTWFVLNMKIKSMKYTCTLQQIITLAYWLAYFAHSFTVQLASS